MSDTSPEDLSSDEPERFMSRRSDRVMAGLAILTLSVGTVAYHFLESWSWVDSFYFSSVALSTVGFGDLTPTSDASKLFTVVYIFSGIALISAFIDSRLKRHGHRVKKWSSRAAEDLEDDSGNRG